MARVMLLGLVVVGFGAARGDELVMATLAPLPALFGTAAPTTAAPVPTTAAAAVNTTADAEVDRLHAPPSMKEAMAEFVAMTMFVVIGCGSAMGIAKEPGSAWVLEVALAFGIAITCLAYSLGCYSGGQINCAVTLTLAVTGKLSLMQALFNFVGQMLGSVAGALVLLGIFPRDMDKTGGLGSNGVSPGFTQANALLGEIFMTFLLCVVVLDSGFVDVYSKGIAVIVIGFAVFLAHCVLIPIDGCSINPTRSFGPALVAAMFIKQGAEDDSSDEETQLGAEGTTVVKKPASPFKDMWVFWVGPIVGSLAAAGVHTLFRL